MAGDDDDDDDHDDNYDDDVTCGLLDGVCQFPCLCIRSMDKMDIDLLCCLQKQILFRKSQQKSYFFCPREQQWSLFSNCA